MTESRNRELAASYARCRQLHRRYGRTYYLATRLLPAWKRPHVHALYGFARYADEIVDALDGTEPTDRAARLRVWSDRFLHGLAGRDAEPSGPGPAGPVGKPSQHRPAAGDPVLPAVLHTIEVFGLDRADFAAFLRSMAMDLTVTSYQTYDDLLAYMEGSAAVIGTMMLPVLGTDDPVAAREPARQLGLAFQLTNFIRDVREDLDRGRIYLPQADLARFGVRPADLRTGPPTPAVRELVAYEVARARAHYALAEPGIALLVPASRRCVLAAHRLYGGILDEVVRARYDVLSRRVRVPGWRRFGVALRCLLVTEGTRSRAIRAGTATFPADRA